MEAPCQPVRARNRIIRYREDCLRDPADAPRGKRVYRFRGFDRADRDLRVIQIRPGLELSITGLRIQRSRQVSYAIGATQVSFAFMLSGRSLNRIRGRSGRKLLVSAGTNCISCLEDIEGDLEFIPENGVVCVSVYISSELLAGYLDACAPMPDPGAGRLLGPSGSRFFIHQDRMTPAMVATARQILDCPDSLPARSLFLEAKVLELLSLKICQWARPSCPVGSFRHGWKRPGP